MKIIIDKTDLERIAEDLLHNAAMLEMSDEDEIEDNLAFYLPRIEDNAFQLRQLVDNGQTVTPEGGVS